MMMRRLESVGNRTLDGVADVVGGVLDVIHVDGSLVCRCCLKFVMSLMLL